MQQLIALIVKGFIRYLMYFVKLPYMIWYEKGPTFSYNPISFSTFSVLGLHDCLVCKVAGFVSGLLGLLSPTNDQWADVAVISFRKASSPNQSHPLILVINAQGRNGNKISESR